MCIDLTEPCYLFCHNTQWRDSEQIFLLKVSQWLQNLTWEFKGAVKNVACIYTKLGCPLK